MSALPFLLVLLLVETLHTGKLDWLRASVHTISDKATQDKLHHHLRLHLYNSGCHCRDLLILATSGLYLLLGGRSRWSSVRQTVWIYCRVVEHYRMDDILRQSVKDLPGSTMRRNANLILPGNTQAAVNYMLSVSESPSSKIRR